MTPLGCDFHAEVRNHDDVVFLVIAVDVSICTRCSMLQFIVFGMKQGFKLRSSSQFHCVTRYCGKL